MTVEDKFKSIVEYRKQQRVTSQENCKYQSRHRLQRIIETKINTTMIGSLSAMEERFGVLWGQGKPIEELSQDELKWLAIKEDLRTEILNNGNNQKRAAIAEISQYDVMWKRHHIDFFVDNKGSGDEHSMGFMTRDDTNKISLSCREV